MSALSWPGLRAVTFDCWSTLLAERDPGLSYARRVEALVRAIGVGRRTPDAADLAAARRALDTAWRRHFALWESGVASESPEMAAWALAELAPERAAEAPALAEAFLAIGRTSEVAALPGARDTLAWLASEGVALALVCDTGFNSGRVVRELLGGEGLLELLPVTVFSDEAGVPKPDPRVFARALDALGVIAAEAVHVGDLRRTDVSGGRGAGLGTIRIRAHHDDRSDLPDADVVASSHDAVARLLGRTPGGGRS